MAVLSSKTTDGSDAFVKYVTKNPRALEIDFKIENGQTGVLFEQNNNVLKEIRQLISGTPIKIISREDINIKGVRYAQVSHNSTKGLVALSKIRKPTGGNGTAYESEVVDAFTKMFKSFGRPITIEIGNSKYSDISYALKVERDIKLLGGASRDPKADIILCREQNKPLAPGSIFISHKKAGGPEAFQQYSGVSDKASPEIYSHPEVQYFLRSLLNVIENDKLKQPVMMVIKDPKLINMAIYGPQYGKAFGIEHCQLIGQGLPRLTEFREDYYKLSFSSHMALSGDVSSFTADYTPVIGATYRAGRGFNIDGKYISGARVMIVPKKLMLGRSSLMILQNG
mgnify:CR=1 FL=1